MIVAHHIDGVKLLITTKSIPYHNIAIHLINLYTYEKYLSSTLRLYGAAGVPFPASATRQTNQSPCLQRSSLGNKFQAPASDEARQVCLV